VGDRPLSAPALRFPGRDWHHEPARDTPNPLPALALIVSIFAVWVGWTVGYLSGRTAERGSQLGQTLALVVRAPALDSAVAESRETTQRLNAWLAKPTTMPRNRVRMPQAPSNPSDSGRWARLHP
jgi:hypothetical protein